jgi:hypothetical protein
VFLKRCKVRDQSRVAHPDPALRDEILRKFRSGFFKSRGTEGAKDLLGTIHNVGNIRFLGLEGKVKNPACGSGEGIKTNLKRNFVESVSLKRVHQPDLRSDFLELKAHGYLPFSIQNRVRVYIYIVLGAGAIGFTLSCAVLGLLLDAAFLFVI